MRGFCLRHRAQRGVATKKPERAGASRGQVVIFEELSKSCASELVLKIAAKRLVRQKICGYSRGRSFREPLMLWRKNKLYYRTHLTSLEIILHHSTFSKVLKYAFNTRKCIWVIFLSKSGQRTHIEI